MKTNEPHLVNFGSNGSLEIGYLAIAQSSAHIPFEVKRIFWAYYTPDSVVRGRHAHYQTEMILVAAAGRIVITTEMQHEGEPKVFVLERPNQGLFIPKMCWHTMQYSHNSVQLVIASSLYEEADYIRDYKTFKDIGEHS